MKTCPVCDTDYPDQHTNCETDGAVLILSRELAPGTLIRGKYRILRKIGQGGMGVVYLAEDSLLGVKVALKFLAGDLGKDPRFIKRFRTEARAAYQLRHPNIAEVTNLDQAEDGGLFIAMEYIEGPSLRAVLDQNPIGLAIPRALDIARGIASGLAAAHAQGTIHRDIKPENVMLATLHDGTERAKVLDFGIAAVAENLTKMTRTQGFILTYAYAAPEQWQEMPADQMDGRTDLYALGCVLYEMLTGQPPFHAHTTAGWMKQHCEGLAKSPSSHRPELAEWTNLDALLANLRAKDRNRRPKDAPELLSLLGAVRLQAASLPKPPEAIKSKQTLVEPRPVNAATNIAPAEALRSSQTGAMQFQFWLFAKQSVIGALALAILVSLISLFAWLQTKRRAGTNGDHPAEAQQQRPAVEPSKSNDKPSDPTVSQRQIPPMSQQTVTPPHVNPESPTKQLHGEAANIRALTLDREKRFSEAAVLFEQACNDGMGTACGNLAAMLRSTELGASDYPRAIVFYNKGCDERDGLSCSLLGVDYERGGFDAPSDPVKARELYQKGCDLNDSFSCNLLGGLYTGKPNFSSEKDTGFPVDLAKARQFLGKSCTLGSAVGCRDLKKISSPTN